MLFKSKRICNKCEELKPLSAYRKDSKGRDGYAVRCTDCKKSKTVSIPIQEEIAKPDKSPKEFAKTSGMIVKITRKFPKHKVLSWNEHGATFQHVSDPKIVWKGKTPEEAIEKALAY